MNNDRGPSATTTNSRLGTRPATPPAGPADRARSRRAPASSSATAAWKTAPGCLCHPARTRPGCWCSATGGPGSDREAHMVLRERAERETYEAVVSLTAGEVGMWREARLHRRSCSRSSSPPRRRYGRMPAGRRRWPARRRRLRHRDDRPVVGRRQRPRGRGGTGPVTPPPDLGPPRGCRRQRLRPPGRRPDHPVRPGPDGGRRHRGPRRGPVAPATGNITQRPSRFPATFRA